MFFITVSSLGKLAKGRRDYMDAGSAFSTRISVKNQIKSGTIKHIITQKVSFWWQRICLYAAGSKQKLPVLRHSEKLVSCTEGNTAGLKMHR